jgi:hypothetical protein
MNSLSLAAPYGVDLVGSYGVDLVGADVTKYAGMYPWQWMFLGAATVLTGAGAYAAHAGSKTANKAAVIGSFGGLVGGGLMALALGRYA